MTQRSPHRWPASRTGGIDGLQHRRGKDGSEARNRIRQDAVLILAALLLFAAVAKFAHPLRPMLILVLGFMVYLLARRSFHLGVSLYALSFAFLSLLPGRLLGIPALNASNLMVMALLGILLGEASRRKKPGPSPEAAVSRSLFGVYVWLVAGIVVAAVLNDVSIGSGFDLLRKFVAVTVPFFFGVAVARQGKDQRAFTAGIILASVAILTSWAFVGFFSNMLQGWDPSQMRLEGRLGQPNSVGAFLAMYLPGFVALGAEGRRLPMRAAGWAGSVLCLSCLFYTRSRGSILAAAAALLLLGVLRYRKLFLASVLAILVFGPWFVPDYVIERFQDTFEGEAENDGLDNSATLRREMYLIAPRVFRESPIVGNGFGAFPAVANRLGRPELARSPHSWYIQVLTELGIVGFALFAWFTLAIGISLWRRPRGPTGTLDGALPSVMLASTVAVAVTCFFQKPFVDNELLMPFYFLAVGITLGATRPVANNPRRSSRGVR